MPVDFYELLGVERDAETGEIKQAFRQKAREYHPDVNDDERATAQFTVVRKAYEVLTDDAERADYDRMGHTKYVNKRLDGLTKFKFPGRAGDDGSASSSSQSSSSSSQSSQSSRSGSSTSRSTGSSRTSSSGSRGSRRSSNRSSSSSSSNRTSSSRSRSSSSSSSSRSSRSSRSSSRSSTASSSNSSGSSRRSSRSSRSSGSSRTGSSRRSQRSSGSSSQGGTTGTSRRFGGDEPSSTTSSDNTNPLWYGWGLSLLVLVSYLGSLGWYVAREGMALVAMLTSLDTAAPAATLLATSPLSFPSVAALQTTAVTSPTMLAVPVTAIVLLVSLFAVVKRFGHAWATWLYVVAAAVPIGIVAAAMLGVPRPVAVDLLGLAVCPVVGAGGFVVDVGRYLWASR
ncbi:DnaJ domain-containing protein [Haloferax larsenii]|uniref:DnaJ domain-containing protein n=1 Tax=Haloferax larsenii TaxID=302484 RepID=A0ABY5RDJ3_HALLR|nr:DnaJ domain-containing protein [Haloferax larsenii]